MPRFIQGFHRISFKNILRLPVTAYATTAWVSFFSFGLFSLTPVPFAADLLTGAAAALLLLVVMVVYRGRSEWYSSPVLLGVLPALIGLGAIASLSGIQLYRLTGSAAEPGTFASFCIIVCVSVLAWALTRVVRVSLASLIRGYGIASLFVVAVDLCGYFIWGFAPFFSGWGSGFGYLLGLSASLTGVVVLSERRVSDMLVFLALMVSLLTTTVPVVFAATLGVTVGAFFLFLRALQERGQASLMVQSVLIAGMVAIIMSLAGFIPNFPLLDSARVLVRPSLAMSYETVAEYGSARPISLIMGGGWNTFLYAWNAYRPKDANLAGVLPPRIEYPHDMWLLFFFSYGLVATLVLGVLAFWYSIQGLLFLIGYRASQRQELLQVLAPACAASYLMTVAATDIMHAAVIAIVAAICTASYVPTERGRTAHWSDSALFFASMFASALLLVLTVFRFGTWHAVSSALSDLDPASISSLRNAGDTIDTVSRFDPVPQYFVYVAELRFQETGILLQKEKPLENETDRKTVEQNLGAVVYYAQKTHAQDDREIVSLLQQGRALAADQALFGGAVALQAVYSPLKRLGAHNPEALLQAAIDFAKVHDDENSKEFALLALALRPGYAEAKQLLALIAGR